MPDVLIICKSERALKALQDLAKVFDISIGVHNAQQSADLRITFAKNPDVTALAGIWEGRDINLKRLRKEGFGEKNDIAYI